MCKIFESNLNDLLLNFNTKIDAIIILNKYTINWTTDVIENLLSTENILWKPKLSCRTLLIKKANTADIMDQPNNR